MKKLVSMMCRQLKTICCVTALLDFVSAELTYCMHHIQVPWFSATQNFTLFAFSVLGGGIILPLSSSSISLLIWIVCSVLIAAIYGGNVYCTEVTAFHKCRLLRIEYSSYWINACINEEHMTIYSFIVFHWIQYTGYFDIQNINTEIPNRYFEYSPNHSFVVSTLNAFHYR